MKKSTTSLEFPLVMLLGFAAAWLTLSSSNGTTAVAAPANSTPLEVSRLSHYLLRDSQEIRLWLARCNHKTVGVLKFKVSGGENAGGYNMGVLNTNAAAILEDCLAIGDVKNELRVLANPSQTAYQKFPSARLSQAVDLKRLVALEYPVRGGGQAKPDVLLTGDIRLGLDKRGQPTAGKISVALKYLDCKNPVALQAIPGINQKPLVFEMPSTRFVMAQSGAGFQLSRKGLTALKSAKNRTLDEQIFQEDTVLNNPNPNPEPQPMPPPKPEPMPKPLVPAVPGVGVLQFRIFYGAEPVGGWMTTGGQPGAITLPKPPPAGTVVTMQLRNPSDQKIGAVVMVNGVNSIFEEREDGTVGALGLSRWILDPGQTEMVKGYLQRDKKNSRQFIGQDPKAIANLGDLAPVEQLGMITVYEIQTLPGGNGREKIEGAALGSETATRDIKSTKSGEVFAKMEHKLTARKKSLIVGGNVVSTPVTDDVLPDPALIGALSIRYYQVPTEPGN